MSILVLQGFRLVSRAVPYPSCCVLSSLEAASPPNGRTGSIGSFVLPAARGVPGTKGSWRGLERGSGAWQGHGQQSRGMC